MASLLQPCGYGVRLLEKQQRSLEIVRARLNIQGQNYWECVENMLVLSVSCSQRLFRPMPPDWYLLNFLRSARILDFPF